MQTIRHQIERSLALRANVELVGSGLARPPSRDEGDLEVDGVIYQETSTPSWASPTAPWINAQYHLATWLRSGDLLAVYSSDKSVIARIQAWLDDTPAPAIRRIPPEYMYAAFASGEAKTPWLYGVHPTQSAKPDGKTIRGVRLQDALDRLEDQTFFDSAVRAALRSGQSAVLRKPITSDAQESRAAYGPTRNWEDFLLIVDALLVVLHVARQGPGLLTPYPYLARLAPDLTGVAGPFEVVSVDAEDRILRPDTTDEEADAATLLQEVVFEVVGSRNAYVETNVIFGGGTIGQLSLRPYMHRKRVVVEPGLPSQPANQEIVAQIRDAVALVPPTIHYLSGHTISDRRIVIREWRDHPFLGWSFEDFVGVTATKEKPGRGNLDDIEQMTGLPSDDSLFGWVVRTWSSGWLVCDDGADEVADFVHLSTDDTLTLIHVKASSTPALARGISSQAFEQVTAQAVKNLRSLENRNLAEDLLRGPRANSTAVWQDGSRGPTRREMVDALQNRSYGGRVAIALVQPHLRRDALEATRAEQVAGRTSAAVARLRRVDDLLHGTARVAAAVGGTVIAHVSA